MDEVARAVEIRCSGPDEAHYSAAEKDVAAIGAAASPNSTEVADSAAHSSADPGLAVLELVVPDLEGPGLGRLDLEASGSVVSAANWAPDAWSATKDAVGPLDLVAPGSADDFAVDGSGAERLDEEAAVHQVHLAGPVA